MNLSADYDPPVYKTVAGERVAFPRFDIEDLGPIERKLADAEAERAERLAEKCRLSPWERYRALQEVERIGVTVPDLMRHFKTKDGIVDGWKITNDKAGRTDEQRQSLRKAIGVLGQASLMIELLSAPEEPPSLVSKVGPQKPDPTSAPTATT